MGSDAAPRRIGRYEIVAKLADGGVGTVYLARRGGPAGFRRLFAIKRLHPQFAATSSLVTMFTDEARLAARIHHANVVAVVDLASDADGYYVVMEYVEGSNLGQLHWHATQRSGQRTMPRPVSVRIVLDALSGLHAAHEVVDDDGTIVDLVHRDVSPQNILIGVDGLARLGDFGIARASALRAFETRGAALKGKLEYMAPEQIECKDVDRSTDLFAMGIVLWELLTGRRLFQAPNQVTTIQRVCFDPIPAPSSVEPTVSSELDLVCAKALERPREQRYATAEAFGAELERAARDDAGIATHREVAAWMKDVLGDAMPSARNALRELGRARASSAPPDLGAAPRGAATQQLPASDPMGKLSPSLGSAPPGAAGGPPVVATALAGYDAVTAAHPPISSEPADTEPSAEVPGAAKPTPGSTGS